MAKEEFKELPFPLGGLDEYRPLARGGAFPGRDRLPLTQSALNVRGVDPRSGRARGGVRPGMTKYLSSQINSSNSIQDISLLYTSSALAGGYGQILYKRSSGGTFGLASAVGVSYYTGGTATANWRLERSCWDDSSNVYVFERNTSTSAVNVYKVTSTGTLTWTSTAITGIPNTGTSVNIPGAVVIGDYIYVAVTPSSGNGRIYRLNTSDGAIATADSGTYWKNSDSAASWAFSINSTGCLAAIGTLLGMHLGVSSANKELHIIQTTDGSLVAATSLSDSDTTAQNNIVSDGAEFFYTAGAAKISKVNSAGTIVWQVAHGATCYTLAYDPIGQRLMGMISSSNVLREYSLASGAVTNRGDPESSTLWYIIKTDNAGRFVLFHDTAGDNMLGLDSSLSTEWGPTATTNTGGPAGVSVNPYPTATGDAALANRRVIALSVAGGSLKRFNDTAVFPVTGGASFSTLATVIFSAQNGVSMFFVDGTVYQYYSATTDVLATWTPSAGTLPVGVNGRARLIDTWRGRTVLAGVPDDPANWYMSAVNSPFDWDYAPATTVPTQAVAGNNSDAGKIGDSINTLVPYSDDLLIFGGDHTIWQMTGDPMAGGSIDRVSDTIGMAWGRPWAKDAAGSIYFMGSRGGVYRLTPGSLLQKLTTRSIDERLAEIDFAASAIRMAWDDRQQGLHVWVSPVDATEATTHFYYDARNNAWWPESYGNVNLNPVAVCVLDGDDPGDRVVLMGGRDGYIRHIDLSATTDDSTAINSYVYLGPLTNVLLKELQATLATGSADLTWSTHVGESAQIALAASAGASGTFVAGRNRSQWPRRYGHAVYLKLGATSGCWSLEQLLAKLELGSQTRQRIY